MPAVYTTALTKILDSTFFNIISAHSVHLAGMPSVIRLGCKLYSGMVSLFKKCSIIINVFSSFFSTHILFCYSTFKVVIG